MRTCAADCLPCCDFCVFFEFNGEADTFQGKVWPNAVYVGKGYCRKFDMCADPGSGCSEFVCTGTVDAQAQPALFAL